MWLKAMSENKYCLITLIIWWYACNIFNQSGKPMMCHGLILTYCSKKYEMFYIMTMPKILKPQKPYWEPLRVSTEDKTCKICALLECLFIVYFFCGISNGKANTVVMINKWHCVAQEQTNEW